MADPILMAKRSDIETFLAAYDPDVTPSFRSESTGQTVLFGALANRDPRTRAAMANRLLDDGATADVVTSGRVTLLHVLLTQRRLDADSDGPLLRRLLAGGAPINIPYGRLGVPLAMLFNASALSDTAKADMYAALFEHPDLDLDARATMQRTVRELIELAGANRPVPYRMMRDRLNRR